MALVNLKSFAIKNVVSLGFNLILARKIETKEIRLLKKFSTIKTKQELKQGIAIGLQAIQGLFKELSGMTKEERQDYLTRLKVELENRRK